MDRTAAIKNVVGRFIVPYVIGDAHPRMKKYARPMKEIWLYLKSCLYEPGSQGWRRNLDKTSAAVTSPETLIDNITNFLTSSSSERIVALAFITNHLAKRKQWTHSERTRLYRFKDCFVNVAILDFGWQEKIGRSTQNCFNKEDAPILLIDQSHDHRHLILTFLIKDHPQLDPSYHLPALAAKPGSAIGLHLPLGQLSREAAAVLEKLFDPELVATQPWPKS